MKQLNWYQIFGKSNIPDGRTVLPTDDIQIWLNCANIWDKAYTTLAEVLADTDTLSALIASENAVDYMVRSTAWAVSEALVPKMTSNTTPSGVASASSVLNAGTYAYSAFDRTDTPWISAGTTYGSNYVQYVFDNEITPSFVEFTCYVDANTNRQELKIQASEDGITYSDVLLDVTETSYSDKKKFTYTLSNTKSYRGFRAYSNANLYNGQWFGAIRELQLLSASICADSTAMTLIGLNNYASNTLLADATWCEAICNSEYFESVLNVKVPTMTDNTHPSGECISSGANQASEANYKAFDGDANTLFSSSGSGTGAGLYLGYSFDAPTKVYLVKAVHRANTTSAVTMNFKYQSKTSDGDWRDISETFNVSFNNTTPTTMTAVSSGSDDVSYRIYRNSASIATRLGMWTLQFYGREDV